MLESPGDRSSHQSSTLRLFVVPAPPDDAKDELAAALQPAYEKYSHLRWARIEDWHITLAFLGELSVTTVPLLRPALARLAADHLSPGLRLNGGGHFDERLFWSGTEGSSPVSTGSLMRFATRCEPAASPSSSAPCART
ncbi:2'-5' RNA ligase [Streptacidiphilus jiangxiensis]|uniref:2'-5' RNA ligase n=1 Tax=Streptacidiphilus jiangxiensis TaxID=235985 RepID=A0A1H7VVF2_STRJI|nr:2'-5' RNA ligase [Streptacidiphilus jiangxiensis]